MCVCLCAVLFVLQALFESAESRAQNNAVRLFLNYIDRACVDEAVRSTFKMIGMTDDLRQMGLGMFETYNGKPVLITKSGSVFRGGVGGVEYFEMDINVHIFNYLSRKVVHSMWKSFPGFSGRIGFVIQGATPLCPLRDEAGGEDGRGDNELPEQICGCVTVDGFDPRAWAVSVTNAK